MTQRAITVSELAKLRADGQWSKFGLAIHTPPTIYTAQSSIMSGNDQVGYLGYTSGVGTLANVIEGMTCLVGTSAGGHELGSVRIRKSPDTDLIYIGEVSDIDWSASRYLTILEQWEIWPRLSRMVDGDPAHVVMDYDIAYSDQHSVFDPVVNMGADWVIDAADSSEMVIHPDASGSFVPGSSVASYNWTASGSPAIVNGTTATPTLAWAAAGQYRISCTVTGANGKAHTGHRNVFIFDPTHRPFLDFEVSSCEGSLDEGGWSFDVTLYGALTETVIRRGTKVILFATREGYGTDAGSLGPLSGAENIICVGWVDGESIQVDPETGGSVSFTVRGAGYWTGQAMAPMTQLSYSAGAPSAWTSLQGLTIDRALWHILHWRSTISAVADISLTSSTRLLPAADCPAGAIISQLDAIASRLLARCAYNRYGQFYAAIDPNLLTVTSRAALPTIMAVTDADYTPKIEISMLDASPSATLDVGGSAYDGAVETPLLARAPGTAPKRFGGSSGGPTDLLVANQAGMNEAAGLLLGQANNPFPSTVIQLAANNRFIDIWPPAYLTLSIEAADAASRIVWADKMLVPRSVAYAIDVRSGTLIPTVTCEAETFPEQAVMVEVLRPGQYNFAPAPSPSGFSFLPSDTTFPPVVQSDNTGAYSPYDPDPQASLSDGLIFYASPPHSDIVPGELTAQDRSSFTTYGYAAEWRGDNIPPEDPLPWSSSQWYLYPGEDTPKISCSTQDNGHSKPVFYPDTVIYDTHIHLESRRVNDYWEIGTSLLIPYDQYEFAVRFTTTFGETIDAPLTFHNVWSEVTQSDSYWSANLSGIAYPSQISTVQFRYISGPANPALRYPENLSYAVVCPGICTYLRYPGGL